MNQALNAYIAGIVVGLVLGLVIAGSIVGMNRPYCPTEDSCGYAWDNGPKIVEVTP